VSLDSYLRAAPKAELHLHLEGTARPAAVFELARRSGVALPRDTIDGVGEWFRSRDFTHLMEVYRTICACLRTADDFELIAYELASELARQNCRYAEVGFTPSLHGRNGVSQTTYLEGLSRARERARRTLGVEIAWVFDISRAMRGGAAETMRWAEYTVGVAIDSMESGVIALGLGGPEAGYPPEPFAPFFERGRAAGLRSFPHAGELAGPASIRGALDASAPSASPMGCGRSRTERSSRSWPDGASVSTSARPATCTSASIRASPSIRSLACTRRVSRSP